MIRVLMLIALVSIPSASAEYKTKRKINPVLLHTWAESQEAKPYTTLARGSIYGRVGQRQHELNWPVKIKSIGHTIASYQQYGFSGPYFHHGVDIRAAHGSDVRASAGGRIVNIENYVPGDRAYWEVAVLDKDGFIWQYHHIERDSIPQAIKDALKTGAIIPAGTKLGEVFKWTVKSFGEYFHHIHLNILGKDKIYHNPLQFLKKLPDRAAPRVTEVQLVSDGKIVKRVKAGQEYSLMAYVEDLILHQHFRVPPYHTWISVNGSPKMTVWKFDHLPGGSSKTKYIHQFFHKKYTCGNYRCRRFGINLGFYRGRQVKFPSKSGTHRAVIGVSDVYGNSTQKTYKWTVE